MCVNEADTSVLGPLHSNTEAVPPAIEEIGSYSMSSHRALP
jgi:hypothetical protein